MRCRRSTSPAWSRCWTAGTIPQWSTWRAASTSAAVTFPVPCGACVPRLAALAPQLATAKHVVITSPDGVFARLAVDEVKALCNGDVQVLEGGTAAWHAFGRPLVKDRTTPPDEACIDFYLRPYDRNAGVEEAMHAYLSWEIDLVHEIERDGTVAFGAEGDAAAA